ncbi:hypothetical protein C1H46_027942 [Malus baccata]|uniref:Retrovirus-related Pol polyprotein from transposon TNT 1-94-like beta-barrel domain-containing protein n=1 Tax=Malus baccata TaxID=106549 RepID=A0A540LJ13_MALBA|nr:hypothetical protein C1H46_027942 [Malus baccata]
MNSAGGRSSSTGGAGGIKIESEAGSSGYRKWGDACKHCGKLDHAQKDCTLLKNNVGAADAIEVMNDALFLTVDSPLESWIFSTAAQFHCTPHKGILEKYTAGNYGKAYSLTTDPGLDIVGKGDVRIKLPGGARWTIHNVRHIPGLVRYLISVGQLDKEGYALQVDCWTRTWKVSKRGEELFTYDFELPPGFISFIRSG